MGLNIVIDYIAGLSLVEWLIFGFIGANTLIAGVCLLERGVMRWPQKIKD